MLRLTCTKCKNNKDITFFPPHNKKKNGVDSWCRECRNNYKKEIGSTLDKFLNDMGKWRKNCRYQRKFDIKFELTFAQKKELWDKQNGLCALTGKPMTHIRGKGKVQTNASIDRIDSNKGYEFSNVQLVMWCVNRAKGEMELEKFVAMCKDIVDHAKSLEVQVLKNGF